MQLKDTAVQRTTLPVVTGQSVLAICYKDGVMMASDTQLCYGNHKKFKDVPRLFSVCHSKVLLGCSGEYSDAQHIINLVQRLETDDFFHSPSLHRNALQVSGYLSRVFYKGRNNFNPLWNQILVAGYDDDKKPFLSYIDFHGTTYQDTVMATGYGAYFAIPLLRERAHPDMSEGEARALLEECMNILSVRDCRAHNKIQIATVSDHGVTIGDMYYVEQNWQHTAFLKPTFSMELSSGSW